MLKAPTGRSTPRLCTSGQSMICGQSPRSEGVENWPGRRNRLPHPVCKPLDSKEGWADGFSFRLPGRPEANYSQLLSLRLCGRHGIQPIDTFCSLPHKLTRDLDILNHFSLPRIHDESSEIYRGRVAFAIRGLRLRFHPQATRAG